MHPLSGNQRPDFLTSLMTMSFVLRLPRKCIFADPLQMSHACHRFWTCYKTVTFYSLWTRCTIPYACHAKRHPNLQKWREHVVLCTFWLGNVLRATTACTFSTSQLPKVVRTWCDLEMCFAPQGRALFPHLNFQKWSDTEVFCTFWLQNVLRANNGVHFFISHLASWLRTRHFSEPTCRPSGASNHWKNTVFRLSHLFAHLHLLSSASFSSTLLSSNLSLLSADFPTFSRICIFFLLTLSLLLFSLLIFLFSLPLPCSAFHLSILSEVWLLNFLRWVDVFIYVCVYVNVYM